MTEHIFILCVSCSNHNKLSIIVNNTLNHIINQIQALLIRKPGNQSDHVTFLIHCKSQLLLQPLFIQCFLLPVALSIIIYIKFSVRRRIINIIVNSIDNALHIHMSCGKQAVQPFSIVIGLYFLCIGIAYCGNIICVYQSAF